MIDQADGRKPYHPPTITELSPECVTIPKAAHDAHVRGFGHDIKCKACGRVFTDPSAVPRSSASLQSDEECPQ